MLIETPRCTISPWRESAEERDALRRWTTDESMMRFITNTAWEEGDRDNFFARQRRSLENAGVCFGPARLRSTGEIVGVAGAQPLELLGDWHLGWWVDPRWQGKGLGVEFAQATLDHAFDVARRARVFAVIQPGNIASCRVAEKVGMTCKDTVRANTLESRWKDEDVLLYLCEREAA